jgi:hypothetical protein
VKSYFPRDRETDFGAPRSITYDIEPCTYSTGPLTHSFQTKMTFFAVAECGRICPHTIICYPPYKVVCILQLEVKETWPLT